MQGSVDTKTDARSARSYAAALEEAVRELLDMRCRARELRERLVSADREMKEALSLVDALAKKVPPDTANRILKVLDDETNAVRINKAAGKTEYVKLIDLLYSSPGREWAVQEVQEALKDLGYQVDNKSAGTTLARLARKGGLIQVARGVYRVPEHGVVVVTSDEVEGALDLTSNCGD